MKAGVFLIPECFDFNTDILSLSSDLDLASKLVVNTRSEFIHFMKSREFDSKIAELLFSTSPDYAGMMSRFYDQHLSKVIKMDINDDDIIDIINSEEPKYSNRLLSIFNTGKKDLNVKYVNRLIDSEIKMNDYCTDILLNYPRNDEQYCEDIQQVYKNLIFLDYPEAKEFKTFNSLKRMTGGYDNFLKAITNFLSYMNKFEFKTKDMMDTLKMMESDLGSPVTPEGGGKKSRSLKRDFLINGKLYTNVNCEFHLKLENVDDTKGNRKHHKNRIYFGFIMISDKNRVAIAHIGEHI